MLSTISCGAAFPPGTRHCGHPMRHEKPQTLPPSNDTRATQHPAPSSTESMSNFAIEIFILLSIGLSVLGIRICVRLETGYGRKLALDDYFTALVVVSSISPSNRCPALTS